MKSSRKTSRHNPESVAHAATLFFMVRGLVRTKLAQGRRLDPYAWLRIETMVYIRDNAGAPMKDIAAYLSITAPSATSLVNALVKGGFVERRTDPRDKRALRVYLTKKGQKKLQEAMKHGMQVLGELFAPLSAKDLKAFSGHLERIQKGN
jgi:DNA-binding MarR family transcriptional regulator